MLKRKRLDTIFGKIYVANCVTLATQVRIEIMRAMSKKYTNDKEDLFVMGYASRPILHVKPKGDEQREMWFSFSDSLVRYGAGLEDCDLGEAYKKAGVAFRGQLQQNFVVLHDRVEKPRNERTIQIANEANVGSPRKRPREELESLQSSKNPKKTIKMQEGVGRPSPSLNSSRKSVIK